MLASTLSILMFLFYEEIVPSFLMRCSFSLTLYNAEALIT
jgi:hypothetical protein